MRKLRCMLWLHYRASPLREQIGLRYTHSVRLLWVAVFLWIAQGWAENGYVLLIGADGVRHDYLDLYAAPRLRGLRETGSSARALIPCFPSTTFPNFYSMATGLRPARHGLIDMLFYDPGRGERFYYREPDKVSDGSWYGGTPIWTLAGRAGLRTASYFWVGTEAEIGGARPSWWHRYDGRVSHEERVRQVQDWLALPAPERPRLVMVYFADVDSASHMHGPESEPVREAMKRVDETVGGLIDAAAAAQPPVNVIVVSDHGGIAVRGRIRLEEYADFRGFHVASGGNLVRLYSQDQALIERTYRALKGRDRRFEVYRRHQLPAHLHHRGNPRAGDLIVMATGPDLLVTGVSLGPPKGTHGQDPRQFPEMRGIFLAAGPGIRRGVRVPAFENVHVYPLVAHLLGLKAPEGIDGRLAPVKALLTQ
ncbi:MAG: alkaline phosphatase family protein [Acidimicrobiia bacterium]|nr:alkaline phosphatase family protein [Acidimicrobiia bacterium]